MITLKDLIVAVKEKNLSKDQLEAYRDQLSSLYADMQLEMADLEKSEALFMDHEQNATDRPSVAQTKINWKATAKGVNINTLPFVFSIIFITDVLLMIY